MTNTPDQTIWIITDDLPEENTAGYRSNDKGRGVEVSALALREKMSNFLQVVGSLFSQAEKQVKPESGIRLDEIELSVEISGSGEIKLIGSGVSTSGKGAVKLKFKRVEVKDTKASWYAWNWDIHS